MHFTRSSLASAAAALFFGTVSAQSSAAPTASGLPSPQAGDVMTHVIQVGDAEGTKKFYPEKVTAQPGELIQFQFYPSEHSIAQSSFDKPCDPIENTNSSAAGFWSGFMPVTQESKEMPVFTIMVNDTKPIWFYCATAKHCQGGMVGVINEPAQRTLETYKETAALVANTGVPANAVSGGTNSTGGGGPATDSVSDIPTNSTGGGSNNAVGVPTTPSPPASADASADNADSAASSIFLSGATLSLMVVAALGFAVL